MSPGDWFPSLRMCVFKNRRTTVNTRKDQNTRNLPEGRKEERYDGVYISSATTWAKIFVVFFWNVWVKTALTLDYNNLVQA